MKQLICGLLICNLFISSAFAGGKVAVVKMMRGKVEVKSKDKVKPLKKGDWVEEGDVVLTQPKSFAKLVFIDKSSVNVGPKSEIKIEKFSKKEAGLLNLVRGKIRSKVTKDYLDMSKGQKEKLYVKSKSAVMGIRGTDFVFSYAPKTVASTAILLEGNVAFAHIRPGEKLGYGDLSKVVDRDNIRIRPGEFSVAMKKANSATIPAVLNVKQRETIEKNENFVGGGTSKRKPASAKKKLKSIVPPGLSGKVVANANSELKETVKKVMKKAARGPASVAPKDNYAAKIENKMSAEGFVADNGAIKPANGSFIHLDSGSVIAPPEDSSFDATTNSYIPTDAAGTIDKTGEYIPPENVVYKEQTGEFIMTVDIGGKTQEIVMGNEGIMPSEPIAGPDSTATNDPVLGMAPAPDQNQSSSDGWDPNFNDGLTNHSDDLNYENNTGTNANQINRATVGFDFTIN